MTYWSGMDLDLFFLEMGVLTQVCTFLSKKGGVEDPKMTIFVFKILTKKREVLFKTPVPHPLSILVTTGPLVSYDLISPDILWILCFVFIHQRLKELG